MMDPTMEEMRAFLDSKEYDQSEFDREAAIYWFACHNHGGQDSNLYAALCESEFSPGPICRGPEKESLESLLYGDLETEFGG